MTWPNGVLPVKIELNTGTEWLDITDDVRAAEGANVQIGRGQPDESSSPEPGSITATLANKTGKYSPRNPLSTLYGKIGRNTPIRVRVGDELCGAQYMLITGTAGTDQATTPDASALHVTGDIDIRVDAAMDTWNGAVLAGRYLTTGDQRSWAFSVTSAGKLSLAWSALGTSASVLSATSTVAASLTDGSRKALRATLDVVNGSVHTTKFYTADTIDGTWTQLGSSVNGSDGTSILAGTADLEVGQVAAFNTSAKTGKVYAFQLLDGIDGTAVADVDFRTQEPTDTSFDDDAGLTWTLNGDTRLFDPGIRGIDEVSEWPPRWDVSGQNATTSITAQGILRRIGQGSKPITAARSTILDSDPSHYWPLDDGVSTTIGSSALAGGTKLTQTAFIPDFDVTADPGVGKAIDISEAGQLDGGITMADTGAWSLSFYAKLLITDTSTVTLCRVDMGTTDAPLTATISTSFGGFLASVTGGSPMSGLLGDIPDGVTDEPKPYHVLFIAEQDGSDIDLTLRVNGTDIATSTLSSTTLRPPTSIRVGWDTAAPDESFVMLGQVALYDSVFTDDLSDCFLGYPSEKAATRAQRLADENDVSFVLIGTASDTMEMGPQDPSSNFVDSLNETYEADMALLFETRDELGLSWRARRDLYNQDVALTLDYDLAGEIAPDLEPIDDDQRVRNDVTVSRKNGGSARFIDTTSRMGTQAPPDGVGVYDDSIELNLADDSTLLDHAAWRVHVGTWDEARYPVVRINMTALAAQGKTALLAQVAGLDVGDRLQLKNLPVWTGAAGNAVDLMCLGFRETFDYPNGWVIEINTVPYGPYLVGVYG